MNREGRWVSVTTTSGFPDEADDPSHGEFLKYQVAKSHPRFTEPESQGYWDPLLSHVCLQDTQLAHALWLRITSNPGMVETPEYKVIVLESENSQGSEFERI